MTDPARPAVDRPGAPAATPGTPDHRQSRLPASADVPGAPHPSTTLPTLAILASTLLWGTLWIPLRGLDTAGLGGAWANAAAFALAWTIALPFALTRRRRIAAGGAPVWITGVLLAAAISLYAEALLRGNVARVVLLFYLSPVWSTLLARAILGTPVTRARAAVVVLGLAGMWVVLGGQGNLPLPRVSAEWMGLLSGMCWAIATVGLHRVAGVTDTDKILVQFVLLAPLFVAATLIPGGRDWQMPSIAVAGAAGGWLVLLGLVWMPAVIGLTVYGASRIDPGRVAVLLMLEVVVGVGSAALLAGEPVGARELVGAFLVLAACSGELVARPPAAPLPADDA